MSSLSTLLEAARFLELQEQSRETAAETLVTMKPPPPPPPPAVPPVQTPTAPPPPPPPPIAAVLPRTAAVADGSPPQTVIISSSNHIGHHQAIIQGPIAFAAATPLQFAKKIEQDGQVSSTTAPPPPRRILHNSFDIRNPPAAADESGGGDGGGGRRKQPPMVFRAGTREVHNKLEKHRRAHLKECFDVLKKQLPAAQDEKKTSNLSILHSALRFIQNLKRKERELEHEMERLAREKISAQQRLAVLKKDISSRHDNIDFAKILPDVVAASAGPSVSRDTFAAADYGHEDAVCVAVDGPPVIDKVAIPILAKTNIPMVKQHATLKEVPQPVQTTSLSVLPMSYPVNQGLVLQKVLVPKGLDGLAPIVSTHFIATPQQINGKVVPLTQYLVKPMVVVSTASPRPS